MKTVIEMAREVGMLIDDEGSSWGSIITTEPDELERFAELVRAPLQERIQDLYKQLNEAERELDSQYKLGMEAERDDFVPLYTAPPQRKPWVGLTDKEAMQICVDCGCMSEDWLTLLDAIEAKLKEKNNG